MKGIIKRILSIVVLIVIVAFFIYYIATHIFDFKQLKLVSPLFILPLILISLIFSFANGLIVKYLLEPFAIRLKIKEWFGLSVITSFYNLIMPLRGGAAIRAVYLKKKHNFPYVNFLATLSGIYVINFFIASFLGLISLFFIYRIYGIFNYIVFAIFLCFFIPLLLIILFSPKFSETKNNFINRFVKVLNGWNLIRTQRKIIIVVLSVTLVQLLLGAFSVVIAYSIFGINISFIKALFLSTIGSLAIVISVTPGSLGIAEAVAVFSALIIGITPAQSLTAAILSRAVSTLVLFTLGPIFSYLLLNNTKKNETRN